MATVTETLTPLTAWRENAHVIVWTPLTTTNADGRPVEMPGSVVRSIHFSGTFGTGGTIKLQGSNNGTSWVDLTDPQGNAISKTAEAIEAIEENTRYVRPFVSAGDGTTSLTATLILRRNY